MVAGRSQPVHGSAFSYAGMGCLLLGSGGSGKSRLLAEALALGATLIADDRVQLASYGGVLVGAAAAELSGVLELRGVGLYRVSDALPQAHGLHLVVELGRHPPRLPEPQSCEYCGITLPLLCLPSPPETSALYLLTVMRAVHEGRILPTDWRPTL